MKLKLNIYFGILLVLAVLVLPSILAATTISAINSQSFSSSINSQSFSSVNVQTYQPSLSNFYSASDIATYWPILSKQYEQQCVGRQDFLVQIAPGGCSPAVVRSDLLEQQNVPVFCRLEAVQLNPLIDVKAIDTISPAIIGKYPAGLAGLGFYPARAAIASYSSLLGSPLINDIGYVVIVLKQNPVEKNMSDSVSGNLTATIHYNYNNAWGVGRDEYFLPILSDEDWMQHYKEYEFYRGQGYLRLDWIQPDKAEISVYRDATHIISTKTINAGDTSDDVYLPGSYCLAAFQIKLNKISAPETSVKLQVNSDKYELITGEHFFNNKCYVSSIENSGGGAGKAVISCTGEGQIVLNLDYTAVTLQVDGKDQQFAVGQNIKTTKTDGNIYLAYSGILPNSVVPGQKKFVLLINNSNSDADFAKKLIQIKSTVSTYIKNFNGDLNKFKDGLKGYTILFDDDKTGYEGITLIDVSFVDKSYSDTDAGKKLESYFSTAVSTYTKISTDYASESKEPGKTYGEWALFQASDLAGELQKTKTQRELLNTLIEKFPDSATAVDAGNKLSQMSTFDTTKAEFSSTKQTLYMRLLSVDAPGIEDSSAELTYIPGGNRTAEPKTTIKGDYIVNEAGRTVKLNDIKQGSILIDYSCKDTSGSPSQTGVEVKQGDIFTKCGFSISVNKINLNQQARVSILPEVKNTNSQVNFTFAVGIEKRAIQLSPEKTKEMIDNLNKTISRWDSLNNKLGEVVKAWNGVCLATSALLQAKNLFANFDGGAIARQNVMRGEDGQSGWVKLCDSYVAQGKYVSNDDCLNKNSDKIDKDVSLVTQKIQAENERIKSLEQGLEKSTGFLGTTNIDTEASRQKYLDQMSSTATNLPTRTENGKEINMQAEFDKIKSNKDYQSMLSYSDLKDIELNSQIYNDPSVSAEMKDMAGKNLYAKFSQVDKTINVLDPKGLSSKVGTSFDVYGSEKSIQGYYRGDTAAKFSGDKYGLSSDTPVQTFTYNNRNYIAVLNPVAAGSGVYTVSKFIEVDDNGIYLDEINSKDNPLFNTFSAFKKIDASSYKNKYKNPEVRYWETAPYKGLPALVPVDTNSGWYAATQQTIAGFGSIKAYEDSGRVVSFWLCNVGADGMEQNIAGDDICEMVNLQTGQNLNLFPGLSSSEAGTLITKAQKILMQAASAYSAGIKSVTLSSGTFKVGNPGAGQLGTKCQDFMSPSDCQILFNVCDPVVCPTSRCNLGGNYYVDDVVQSGILGSIALCLPNYKEGILVPVCLTGIHAGIDSYLSILKAHRDCLQESLTTGKTVGICDEIYSIYLCDFFWKQATPLMNLLVPKLIESAYGQGTRGGGEYLTVQSAWDNAQKSMAYFTNSYAVNAANAFKVRSTAEIGSEVCKSFVSQAYPNKADLLLEPESPVQFSAWFSESAYTDATVPATSQYQVYYHIYAGKDQGVYYTVYLSSPPGTSFYQSNPTISVATNFIPVGQFADETRTFTAPAGYKQLCVRINDKEECGFKQVSSSFAVNYIKDEYMAEQGSQSITSTADCISGTSSAYSLLQPNLQAGAENAINPSIYNNGINRICASDNPGSTTEPGRWADVGYCDDQKMRCWIDEQSVKNVIQAKDLENQTLAAINQMNVAATLNGSTPEQAVAQTQTSLASLNNQVNAIRDKYQNYLATDTKDLSGVGGLPGIDSELQNVTTSIDSAFSQAIMNGQKAQLLDLKAGLFDSACRVVYNKGVLPGLTQASTGTNTNAGTNNPENTASSFQQPYYLSLEEGKYLIYDSVYGETGLFIDTSGNKIYYGPGLVSKTEVGAVKNNILSLNRDELIALNIQQVDKWMNELNGTTINTDKLSISTGMGTSANSASQSGTTTGTNAGTEEEAGKTSSGEEQITQPSEPVFTLDNNHRILQDGKETELSIDETKGLIMLSEKHDNSWSTLAPVGTIKNNVLSFSYDLYNLNGASAATQADLIFFDARLNGTTLNSDGTITVVGTQTATPSAIPAGISGVVFEFQDGTSNVNYYYEFDGEWKWGTNTNTWHKTTDAFPSGLMGWLNGPSTKTKNMISQMSKVKTSQQEGIQLLIDRTKVNKEGGVANDALVTNKVTLDYQGIYTIIQGSYSFTFQFSNNQWYYTSVTPTGSLVSPPILPSDLKGLDEATGAMKIFSLNK